MAGHPLDDRTRSAAPPSDTETGDEFERRLLRLADAAGESGPHCGANDALDGCEGTGPAFSFLAAAQAPGELGRLGSYRVFELLGQGGMGAVFRAEDPALGRHVALKVMLPEHARTPTAKARFLREARSQAQVEHDHVAVIHHVGEHDGVPFLIMPLLKGRTLAAALAADPRPAVGEAVRIAREMAEGLAAAHDKRLVHRDIKPGNVWLEGDRRRVKILDFGLARPVSGGDTELAPVTNTGAVVGTPAYMSPEQARGESVDHRSDLFSLGAVLYRMLTGRGPFAGPSVTAVLLAVVGDTPRRPAELNPQVPAALDALVMRLLAKDPAARPTSATAVAEELRAIESATTPDASGSPRPVLYPLPVPVERAEDVFADLNTEVTSVTRTEPPRNRPAGARRSVPLVGALALVAAAGAIAFVAFQNLNQPVPRGGAEASPTPPRPAPKPDNKKPPQPSQDRATAELVLSLGGKVFVDGQAEHLVVGAPLPQGDFALTGIQFNAVEIKDADLARLPRLPGLTMLVLAECLHLTDAALEPFRECRNLAFLDLHGSLRFTNAGLAHFRDLRTLRVLYLGSPLVTDAGLELLKENKDLLELELGGCKSVTDAGLVHFKDCKQLKALRIHSTAATDAALAHFIGCDQLAYVTLDGPQVTAAGTARLKAFPNLARLELEGDMLTDEGLENVNDLKQLKTLALHRATRVTDAGLNRLTVGPRLVKLVVGGCPKVTDAGLAAFRDGPALAEIVLLDCPKITDEALRLFEGCPNLVLADLNGSGFTAAGVERFAEAVPRCRIKFGPREIAPRK